MKKLQQFCFALVLGLVLTISAPAGEIPGPGTTTPPPPPSSVMGEIPGPGIESTSEMSASDVTALDPVTEAMLSLLQSILSIF